MSSASPPRNCSSDLRLLSAGAPHESTSPASNLARASARTLVLRLTFPTMHYCCAIQTLRRAAPQPFSRRSATETDVHRQQRQPCKRSGPVPPHTNPIVLGAASFKSLYLKRPHTPTQQTTFHSWALSDTALRLIVTDSEMRQTDLQLSVIEPAPRRAWSVKVLMGESAWPNAVAPFFERDSRQVVYPSRPSQSCRCCTWSGCINFCHMRRRALVFIHTNPYVLLTYSDGIA